MNPAKKKSLNDYAKYQKTPRQKLRATYVRLKQDYQCKLLHINEQIALIDAQEQQELEE